MKLLIVLFAFIFFGCGDSKTLAPISNPVGCTLVENVLTCPDGTELVIANGIDGQDGADGVDGIDGQDGADGQDGVILRRHKCRIEIITGN